MASLRVSCVVALICMVVITAPMAEAAITCGTVAGAIGPCLTYLRRDDLFPSELCCGGVRNLNSVAQSTADRRTACNCFKYFAGAVHDLDANNLATLPAQCGVTLPYMLSTSTNSSRSV